LARLEERLWVKGAYGHGKGDLLVVGWEFNLARRQQVEEEIERIEAALKRVADLGLEIVEERAYTVRGPLFGLPR